MSMLSAYSLKQELEILIEKKREINNQFDEILTQITRYTDRLRNCSHLIQLKSRFLNFPANGRSVAQLMLWQKTGATLIAIRRGTEVIISLGSGAILQSGDRLVVVGSGNILEKAAAILNE